VHAHGVDIGAVEQRLVGAGIVFADALDQLVLAQKLGGRSLDGRRRRNRLRLDDLKAQ
jgi:hypothetical protein